jgi:hypothetical protein
MLLPRTSRWVPTSRAVVSKVLAWQRLFFAIFFAIFLRPTEQILIRNWQEKFASFNRMSESIEKNNNQICDLLFEPIVSAKRLERARSKQQRDIARSFETEEQIGRLLESDPISDIARRQHELGKVR